SVRLLALFFQLPSSLLGRRRRRAALGQFISQLLFVCRQRLQFVLCARKRSAGFLQFGSTGFEFLRSLIERPFQLGLAAAGIGLRSLEVVTAGVGQLLDLSSPPLRL